MFNKTVRYTALATTLLISLTACSSQTTTPSTSSESTAAQTSTSAAAPVEVTSLTPRVHLTFDGGIMTVNAETGEVIAETERDGFLRLNHAGDGRHLMVSAGNEFLVFDSGLREQPHGDHSHYYEQDPVLTEVTFPAEMAGHVVVHNDTTALFADGTGEITLFDPAQPALDWVASATTTSTEDPHHGVAVPLLGHQLLLTQGTTDERHTVQVQDAQGSVIAETTDCPGVHGEATALPTDGGDVVTLGCTNGPVVFRDGAFHKVAAETEYERTGNQHGHAESPIVLTDFKTEKEPEGGTERTTRIGLLNTRTDSLDVVDLGSSYWFRSLARGPQGEALILTYDGNLTVVDEETGEITHRLPVIEEWQEKSSWQEPGPAIRVAEDKAYITDAATDRLHIVDLTSMEVISSIDLPHTPNEIAVTTGKAAH